VGTEGSEVCTSIEEKYYLSALESLGLEISSRDDVLKMLRGSIVVMNSVQRNNLYYLKGTMITGQLATFIRSDDDCT